MALKVAKPGAITVKTIRESGAKNRTEFIKRQSSPKSSSSKTTSNNKQDLKETYGDYAPGNIITTKEGKIQYTSKTGQRFDTPEQAVAANLKISNPRAFNKNLKDFGSERNIQIREATSSLTGKAVGGGQFVKITDKGQVIGYSAQQRFSPDDVYVGDVRQKSNIVDERIKNIQFEVDKQVRKSEQVINRQVLQSQEVPLTASEMAQGSAELSGKIRKLQKEGVFGKPDVGEKPTEIQIRFERAEGRVGKVQSGVDEFLNPFEKRKDVVGFGASFVGGLSEGATGTAQGILRGISFASTDIPKGLPKTQKIISDVNKDINDFVFASVPIKQKVIGEFAGGIGKAFADSPGRFVGRLGFDALLFKGATKTIGGAVTRVSGFTKTIGKPFIASERIIVPEVLKGVEKFPLTRGFKAGGNPLKEFLKSPVTRIGKDRFVFSATPQPFAKQATVIAGRGLEKSKDVPGLFVSTKGVSPFFTRIFGKASEQYKLIPTSVRDLVPSFKRPQILAFKTTPQRIPSNFTRSFKQAQGFFGKEFVGRQAILKSKFPEQLRTRPTFTPAATFSSRVEAEAVFGVGKIVKQQQVLGFTKFSRFGPRVPIIEYKVIGTAGKVERQVAKLLPGKGVSSSLSSSKSVLFSPSSIGFGLSRSGLSSFKSSQTIPSFKSYFSNITKGFSSSFSISKPSFSISGFSGKPSSSKIPIISSGFGVPSSIVSGFSEPSISTTSSSFSGFGGGSIITPTPNKPMRKTDDSLTSQRPLGTYNAYVRKNNNSKWVKATKKPQPYNRAFNQGLFVADNTTAASVKVKRASKRDLGFDDPFITSEKFRRRQRKTKVPGEEVIFVEKNRFRIDTLGEKQGLKASKFLKRSGLNWEL